jgi:hypothetical protein
VRQAETYADFNPLKMRSREHLKQNRGKIRSKGKEKNAIGTKSEN